MGVTKAAKELDAANKAQDPPSTISQRVEEVTSAALQEFKAASILVTTATKKLIETTSSYKHLVRRLFIITIISDAY